MKKRSFGTLKQQLAGLFNKANTKPFTNKFLDNYIKTFINVPDIETTHKLHVVGDK